MDIFNKTDKFFTTVCVSYPNNGTDVTVNRRRTNFNSTASCSPGCIYNGFNNSTNYINCNCEIASLSDISLNFKKSFFNRLFSSNIKLLVCVDQAFNTKKLKKNIGLFVKIAFTSFCIIVLTLHFKKQSEETLRKNIPKIIQNDAYYIADQNNDELLRSKRRNGSKIKKIDLNQLNNYQRNFEDIKSNSDVSNSIDSGSIANQNSVKDDKSENSNKNIMLNNINEVNEEKKEVELNKNMSF